MKEKIILLGGGGHAKVVIETIRLGGNYEITGILAPEPVAGTKVSGVEVVGLDEDLPGFYDDGVICAAICLGSTGDMSGRRGLYEKVKAAGFKIPSLVHPNAVVSSDAVVSEGVQIMAGVVVQTGSRIGVNTVVNTASVVEHDCDIGDHAFIGPGALILGDCVVGKGTFIGAGAIVRQKVKIGENVVVAAGAVVIGDIGVGARVKGVPAEAY